MTSAGYTEPELERFWAKVDKQESGCWLWTASRVPSGYGAVTLTRGRRRILAHRMAYEVLVGPIPDGLDLDHLCRVRQCVNPDHLEPVTRAENLRRSMIAPSTINALKTHCDSGHPLSGDNLYVDPGGRRQCRTCRARHTRRMDRIRREQGRFRVEPTRVCPCGCGQEIPPREPGKAGRPRRWATDACRHRQRDYSKFGGTG